MRRSHVHSALATLAALGLLACGSPTASSSTPATAAQTLSPPATAAAGGSATVTEVNAPGKGGAFEPPSIEVAVGTTVRFRNGSGNIHNVTFEDPAVKSSGVMSPGDVFEASFPRVGTFAYRCTFHPGMTGTVVVK